MPKSEENVLNYVLRRARKGGELQEPITEIATATGHSTATVWRALNSLEEKGIIEIIKTSDNKEANKIIPKNKTGKELEVFEKWITDGEELIKLSKTILEHFRENKKLIEDLQNQLEAYRELARREVKTLPLEGNYELVIRRTDEPAKKEDEDKEFATALMHIFKQNLDQENFSDEEEQD